WLFSALLVASSSPLSFLSLSAPPLLSTLFPYTTLFRSIIFRYGGTTGGVDIIARIVNKYIGWSMGKTMFIFDFIVITTSVFVILDLVEGMYTLVAVYIGARIIDFIQEGAYSGRAATIISYKSEEIAKMIHIKMDRGVTVLSGKG